MKVLVISKTITNAGDYLFADRMMKILRREYPGYEFIYNNGSQIVEEEVLDTLDRIIISGGPGYDSRLMSYGNLPFLHKVFSKEKKVSIIGMGCYGSALDDSEIYEHLFSNETIEILKRIEDGGGVLGTRDYVTSKILKKNGFSKVLMTGCPAWYDLDYMFGNCADRERTNIKNIIISDPGLTKKQSEQIPRAMQAIKVVDYVKNRFPYANITFTFNGGIRTKYSRECNEIIEDYLKQNGIEYHDISGNSSGFGIYNNTDLHIGFRVHSHIYCLSRRIPTVLIEEDIRGYGVNDVLGLEHIANSCNSDGEFAENKYLIDKIDDAVARLLQSEFWDGDRAYESIKHYYKKGMKVALKEALQ